MRIGKGDRMIGFLITTDGHAGMVDFEDTLDEIYALLEVECIDIVRIADGLFAVVDDEGLLKDDPLTTVWWPDSERCLVGNVLITGDGGRDLGSLTPGQLEYLADNLVETWDGRPVLVMEADR